MNLLRRKYYIYPEIQKPLIQFLVLSIAAITIIQSGLIYFSMKWLEAKTQVDISIVVDYRVLGSWRKLLYFSILIPMILNVILGVFIVLYVSNKFAGPIFRLERELDQHLSGEKKDLQVKFRESDFLHSLAQKINRLNKPRP